MNRTKIEWVKNPDGTQGYTWNPITGCLNHDNGICRGGGFPCYAYKLAHGRLRERYLANKPRVMTSDMGEQFEIANDPFYPRFWPERMHDFGDPNNPDHRNMPRGIFVCDMGELFGPWVPMEWQEHILEAIRDFPQHRFYLLTKQPQELKKWSPFPDNCWVGATITNNDTYYRSFYGTPWALADGLEAKVKYISFEPLLESLSAARSKALATDLQDAGISWLIIGAQTKPYKPPKIEWVQEIVKAADEAGIPVFLKDNLKPICLTYPEGVLRQEMPSAGAND